MKSHYPLTLNDLLTGLLNYCVSKSVVGGEADPDRCTRGREHRGWAALGLARRPGVLDASTQVSIWLERKNALAMLGLCGSDRCQASRSAIVQQPSMVVDDHIVGEDLDLDRHAGAVVMDGPLNLNPCRRAGRCGSAAASAPRWQAFPNTAARARFHS